MIEKINKGPFSSIRQKINYLAERTEIIKHKKFKPKPECTHLVKYKPELDYEYYICDYCGQEIKIEGKWENKTGGIADLPNSITNRGKIKIAVHNECLKNLLKEFREAE